MKEATSPKLSSLLIKHLAAFRKVQNSQPVQNQRPLINTCSETDFPEQLRERLFLLAIHAQGNSKKMEKEIGKSLKKEWIWAD